MGAKGYDDAINGADGVPRGRIAQLSIGALRHASVLPIDNVAVLAARLYRYNTLPLAPAGEAADAGKTPATDLTRLGLATPAVAAALIATGPALHRAPTATGCAGPPRSAGNPPMAPAGRASSRSPAPVAIRDVFAATVAAATSHHALAFKAGAGPTACSARTSWSSTSGTATTSTRRRRHCRCLAGAPAQGVPFSAGITDDGMLSWNALRRTR